MITRLRLRWRALPAALAALVLVPTATGDPARASAGAVDPAFGDSGVVSTDLGLRDALADVLVQPDGKAVSIGSTEDGGVVLRHRTDGSLDPSFGASGIVRGSPPTAALFAGALQPDGRIVVVGANATFDDFAVVRYLPSGAPDATFGAGGMVQTDLGSADDPFAVALQPDGRIVVAGRSGDRVALVRYLANGALDPGFGSGGRTTTSFGVAGSSSEATSIGILSTGAIVVGGRTVPPGGGSSMLLARYTPGGVLDPTFGTGGRVTPADERLVSVSSLVVQAGDRVVVAGSAAGGFARIAGLARYLPTGSLDPTFGTGGSTRLGPSTTIDDLAVVEGGLLRATGAVVNAPPDAESGFNLVWVARFAPDGTADPTFGCAGSTSIEVPAERGGRGRAIAVAPDGRLLVGGTALFGPTLDLPSRSDFILVRFLVGGPPAEGYWITRADGGLSAFGAAGGCGSLRGLPLNKPIVDHAARPTRDGYWFVASDGGVFAFGDARFFGSTGGMRLNRPVVGMAATPSGTGYWLVASDGGIFAFGNAGFSGSTGSIFLNQPVVGMAATPTGRGYWLVARDGGVFAFGDASFFGSTGSIRLNQPVVGMAATPSGRGYWLVARDGGVFAFGDAGFFGSTGGIPLNRPIVGMARTATEPGYWLAGADGGVFAFGAAPFLGSTGRQAFASPAVAIT